MINLAALAVMLMVLVAIIMFAPTGVMPNVPGAGD